MNPEFILNFWLDEVGPDYWHTYDDSLDSLIEQKFCKLWMIFFLVGTAFG
jgi:uncharacterized protein (DUF924 family)